MSAPTSTTTTPQSPIRVMGGSPELTATLLLLKQGLRVLPLRVPGTIIEKGKNGKQDKIASGKEPIGNGWGKILHTEESIRNIHAANPPIGDGPGVGVGLLLGTNPDPHDPAVDRGILDIEVDDPVEAAPVKDRMFQGCEPATLGYDSNRGGHKLYRYDPRLAKYGLSIVKGKLVEVVDEDGEVTTKVEGNSYYLGVEIRIGTLDPKRPAQLQSVIPPTRKADGEPRVWKKGDEEVAFEEVAHDLFAHILPLPESVFEDLDRYANAAKEQDDKEKAERRKPAERTSVTPIYATSGEHWDADQVKAAVLPHVKELAEEWGVVFTGKRFPSTGFLECYGVNRTDNKASAGLNDRTGVFNDFGGHPLSIFDLGLSLGKYPDFPSMVNELGRRYGVQPKQLPSKYTQIQQAIVDRSKVFEVNKFIRYVEDIVESGSAEDLYKTPSTVVLLARLKDCDSGKFKLLRDKFKTRAKTDTAFSVGDLDEAVRPLMKAARAANKAAMKEKQKGSQPKRPSARPTLEAITSQSQARARESTAEPTAEEYQAMADQVTIAKAAEREFANFVWEDSEDEAGNNSSEEAPLTLHEIDFFRHEITKDWPKRVGERLFVPSHRGYEPVFLESPSRLTAWIGRAARVAWCNKTGFVTREEYHEHLKMTATAYDSIEVLPHWPKIEAHYYMHPRLPGPTGKLKGLLDFFSPATDTDRDLIKAMILTLFWGGPPSSRPAFLITSKDDETAKGCGVGKSKFGEIIGDDLCGGIIEVDANGDMETIKTRMLSPSARHLRAARMDNIKSPKLSWGEFEGLLTMPTISGRELYEGEGRRPNLLTWILTINGASLSTDIAQRVVVIKLDRPKPRLASQRDWQESVKAYIKNHRWEIIADIIATLQTDVPAIQAVSRWALWEREILGRIGGWKACQDVILERQKAFDADDSERDVVRDYIADRIHQLGHVPRSCFVKIPSATIAGWVSEIMRKPYAPAQASSKLNNFRIPELAQHRTTSFRGYVWKGGDCPDDVVVADAVLLNLCSPPRVDPIPSK